MNLVKMKGIRPGNLVRTPFGEGRVKAITHGILGREVIVDLLGGKQASVNENFVEVMKG